MFFNGLIRKFKDLPSLAGHVYFKSFDKSYKAIVDGNSPAFTSPTNAFNDTHVMTIFTAPPLVETPNSRPPMTFEEKQTLEKFLDDIMKVFPVQHRIIDVRLFWINPGESIPKHSDERRMFKRTKRFNVIVRKGKMRYFCFKGSKEKVQIPLETGDVYELNNISYHELDNPGNETGVLLILDFVDMTKTNIMVEETLLIDKVIFTKTDENTPVLIWDY